MGCQHLEELYELYLLGALDPEDAEQVSEHVRRGCPNCARGLREAGLTVYLLCQIALSSRGSRASDSRQKAELLRRLKRR